MPKLTIACLALASATLLFACEGRDYKEAAAKHGFESSEIAEADAIEKNDSIFEAVANINPLASGEVKGKVAFTRVQGGIKIVADLEGLKPGKHGIHIHEYGICSGEGSSAGSHLNPHRMEHGGPDNRIRHVGDLGNLVADDKGRSHYERIDDVIAFDGPNSIIGKSVVVHADPDDLVSQPSGNAGGRIGCGIIKAVKKQPPQ